MCYRLKIENIKKQIKLADPLPPASSSRGRLALPRFQLGVMVLFGFAMIRLRLAAELEHPRAALIDGLVRH